MAEAGKVKKVMLAIDESECSHYALEWVLHNIRDCILPSSPLILFTVQSMANLSFLTAASIGSARMPLPLSVTTPELVMSIQEQQRNIELGLLEKAKEICVKEGVAAETITEVGDPKEAICEAVEKLNIDLLILGNHGRGVIQRTFLGSVSNYCVHNAKCPVLVVKKKA